MATFLTQIEALAGSSTSPVTTQAVQWFNDGIKDAVNRISMVNPQMLALMSANGSAVNDSNGESVEDAHRILSVRRGSKTASEISPFDRFDAASTTSLKRATDDHPKYYILNSKLFVLPTPDSTDKQYTAAVRYASITDLSSSTIGITHVIETDVKTDAADPSVFTKANHGFSNKDLVKLSGFTEATELNGMFGLEVEAKTTNSFTLKGISADPAETTGGTVETMGTGFPEEFYRLPVLYSAIKVLHEKMVHYADELPGDITLPSVPIAPSSAITLSEGFTTLTFPSSVVLPSYVSVAEPSFADLDISSITVPTIPATPSYVGEKITMPSSAKVPVYTSVDFEAPLVQTLDFTQLELYIETEEDPELAASQISKLNTKIQLFQAESQSALQKYQSDMQNELNIFNDANGEYQALMQKALQDAQISSQREVQEYGSRIQRHAQEVTVYQAKVNSTVQVFATEEVQLKLAKYQVQLGNSIAEYQASVGAVVQKYSADISRESAVSQVDVQRIAAELQQKSQKITLDLQKYGAESNVYQVEVGSLAQKFNAELQKTNTEYQWKAGQMAYLMSEYEKALIPIQLPKEVRDGGQN